MLFRIFESPFFRHKGGVVALIVLLVFLIFAIFAPYIAPYPPNEADFYSSLEPLSRDHPLGTDKQGRDVLSRVIFGTRTTLLGALFVVIISGGIGIPLGIIAGFFDGFLESAIMRTWDVLLAFPSLLLAFILIATFGRGFTTAIIAIGIVYIPMISRLARSVTLKEKNEVYSAAAKSLGCSNFRVMYRHILPNCVNVFIVQSTLDLGYAIIDLSALSFLGLGVQPPTADWGVMLSRGTNYLMFYPYVALAGGFAIMITVISFNVLGDALQTYLDPKQRISKWH